MKLLLCGECMDIRAPHPEGEWTACRCGNAEARWANPSTGQLRVRAKHQCHVRVIGMNNMMIWAALGEAGLPSIPKLPRPKDNDEWRKAHADICSGAKGYIFHDDFRACWAAIMSVGETGDVKWESWPDPSQVTP